MCEMCMHQSESILQVHNMVSTLVDMWQLYCCGSDVPVCLCYEASVRLPFLVLTLYQLPILEVSVVAPAK